MKYEDFKQTDLYLGPFMFFRKGPIKVMLAMLLPNEEIKLVTTCNSNVAGVVTLTDKRILFTSKVLFTSVKKEVLLKDVTSISYTGIIVNKLTISSYGSDVLVITAIKKSHGEQFIQTYNLLKQAEGMRAESSFLGLSDLEQLAELRDKGIISVDEFEQTKRKILGI